MEYEQVMLENAGFSFDSREWIRGEWTIRFDGDVVEAFDEELYYTGTSKDLKEILEDIG